MRRAAARDKNKEAGNLTRGQESTAMLLHPRYQYKPPSQINRGECCNLSDLFTQKELVEILMGMKSDLSDFRVDLKETQTLIRDYNGLRAEVGEVRGMITKCQTKCTTEEKVGDKNFTKSSFNIQNLILFLTLVIAIVACYK